MIIKRLKLHHFPASRSARVRWLLHEIDGPEVELSTVQLYEGAQHAPEFVALNPGHAVPVLEVDVDGSEPVVIVESGAIVVMLADAYPDAKLAPPPTPFSRERADYLQTIHHCGAAIDMMLWQIRAHEEILGSNERDERTVQRYRGKFAREVEPLLAARLGASEYVCGNAFSAADCMVGHAVMWARRYGLCSAPSFKSYVSALSRRPAFQKAFDDAHLFRKPEPLSGALAEMFKG